MLPTGQEIRNYCYQGPIDWKQDASLKPNPHDDCLASFFGNLPDPHRHLGASTVQIAALASVVGVPKVIPRAQARTTSFIIMVRIVRD